MEDHQLEAIADAWWGSAGDEDVNDVVDDLAQAQGPEVSRLIALMVRSPHARRVPFVGTAIVEYLYQLDPASSLELVMNAQLSPQELFEVLSGVYPDLLVRIGARERLAGTFDRAQIHWLTTYDAPDRHDTL